LLDRIGRLNPDIRHAFAIAAARKVQPTARVTECSKNLTNWR
jgi:hypothetical protein